MTKWLHTLGSLAVIIATALTPAISTVVVSHPAVAVSLGALYAILGHLLPSPIQSKEAPIKNPGI